MESKLFSQFDPNDEDNKQFLKDLRQILDLSEDQLITCVASASDLRLAQTRSSLRTVADAIAGKTKLTHTSVVGVWRVLRFFLDRFIQTDKAFLKGDTPAKWVADLHHLKCITESQTGTLSSVLERLQNEVVPKVSAEIRRREFASGVFPTFKGFGATVEMRAIQHETYDWDNPLDEYSPQVVDITPVASIHISLDAGTPAEFFFQIDEKDLNLLINCLKATQKDIVTLKTFVREEKEAELKEQSGD